MTTNRIKNIRKEQGKVDPHPRLNIVVPDDEELKGLVKSILLLEGYEAPDPYPTIVPADDRPPTLQDQVLRIMNHHLTKRNIEFAGYETEEEANDFNIPGDNVEPDFGTEYTVMEDEEPIPPDVVSDVVEPEVDPVEPVAEDPPVEPVDPPAPAEN